MTYDDLGDLFFLKQTSDLAGLKFIDLFAGIGGFHIGLSMRGAECVFASELDQDAADVYERNHGIRPHGDIKSIDEADVPVHDILCAGFPCQPFSASGKGLGFDDERGQLFFDIVRIARHHKPRVVILENVPRIIKHDGGRTFETIASALEEIGYGVHSLQVGGKDVTLPQDRERVFIVGLRKDIDVGKMPFIFPMVGTFSVDTILQSDQIERPVGFSAPYVQDREIDGQTQKVQRLGGYGQQSQGARVYDPRGRGVTLCSQGGGGGALTGLYLVGGKVRKLTARECARMAGFPDTFEIHEDELTAIRQFGNSVMPQAVDHILRSVIRVLAKSRPHASVVAQEPLDGSELDAAVLPGGGQLDQVSGDIALRDPDGSGDRFRGARQERPGNFEFSFDDFDDGNGFRRLAPSQEGQRKKEDRPHDVTHRSCGFHFTPPKRERRSASSRSAIGPSSASEARSISASSAVARSAMVFSSA